MWNNNLGKRIPTYSTAVLSVVEANGYPMSIRCQVSADAAHHLVRIVHPSTLVQGWRGRACLLFHEHDARLESLRQMVVLGKLQDEGGSLIFMVETFVTANGSSRSDRMPHASSPFQMFRFFWLGWCRTRAYLATRGEPWPAIPYETIARLVDAESTSTH